MTGNRRVSDFGFWNICMYIMWEGDPIKTRISFMFHIYLRYRAWRYFYIIFLVYLSFWLHPPYEIWHFFFTCAIMPAPDYGAVWVRAHPSSILLFMIKMQYDSSYLMKWRHYLMNQMRFMSWQKDFRNMQNSISGLWIFWKYPLLCIFPCPCLRNWHLGYCCWSKKFEG
jgi:hypothetical protein